MEKMSFKGDNFDNPTGFKANRETRMTSGGAIQINWLGTQYISDELNMLRLGLKFLVVPTSHVRIDMRVAPVTTWKGDWVGLVVEWRIMSNI